MLLISQGVGCVIESVIAKTDLRCIPLQRCTDRRVASSMCRTPASARCGYMMLATVFLLVTMLLPGVAGAQKAGGPGAPPSKALQSATDACGEFRNAAKPGTKPNGKTTAEQAEQGYGRIAGAGQLGLDCAKALAKHFENLRKGGGSGTWSEIEQELDMVIGTYRNLVVAIEGADGVYDQGTRAVKGLDGDIADMKARRGENHPNVINARKTQASLASSLEVTKKLKVSLVVELDNLMGKKAEIAEAIGTQRYAAAQKALDHLNEGLSQVVDELVREVRKRPTTTPGG